MKLLIENYIHAHIMYVILYISLLLASGGQGPSRQGV